MRICFQCEIFVDRRTWDKNQKSEKPPSFHTQVSPSNVPGLLYCPVHRPGPWLENTAQNHCGWDNTGSQLHFTLTAPIFALTHLALSVHIHKVNKQTSPEFSQFLQAIKLAMWWISNSKHSYNLQSVTNDLVSLAPSHPIKAAPNWPIIYLFAWDPNSPGNLYVLVPLRFQPHTWEPYWFNHNCPVCCCFSITLVNQANLESIMFTRQSVLSLREIALPYPPEWYH